jgi:hypothetical protein
MRTLALSPSAIGLAIILRSWWARFAGAPARRLMGCLLTRLPHASHSGIRLIVLDRSLATKSDLFFARTSKALDIASERAPDAYAALRRNIQQIVLRERTRPATPSYHWFQLAAVVTPDVALEANVGSYATWLLYASGLSRGVFHAEQCADEFLKTLDPTERRRASEWLHSNLPHEPR